MSTYAESKEFCRRQSDEWQAEFYGVCAAAEHTFKTPPPFYSKDPGLQHRYNIGFERGKQQLQIEASLKEVPHDRTPQPATGDGSDSIDAARKEETVG